MSANVEGLRTEEYTLHRLQMLTTPLSGSPVVPWFTVKGSEFLRLLEDPLFWGLVDKTKQKQKQNLQ